MPALDNRPPLGLLLDKLAGVPKTVMTAYEPPFYPLLQQLLDASIAWVETEATVRFNPVRLTDEPYDGNGTNKLTLRKRPILSVQGVRVETPILGYNRVYTPAEIQVYPKQGQIMVFTYKLAVEQALIQTIDTQAWASLFPPLPNAVKVSYTYGFPQYDPQTDQTSVDGGVTWTPSDTRDPELVNWMTALQQAALCDAAASFLAQSAGLAVGLLTSVSFDGYSRSSNPAAFGAQVQALVDQRDKLMARRKRQFYMSVGGGGGLGR